MAIMEGKTNMHKLIEYKNTFKQIALVFAVYEKLKYKNDEFLKAEVIKQRAIIKNYRQAWRGADSLYCGAQDALGDRCEKAFAEFRATFDAIRMIRGNMPRNIIYNFKTVIGE
jgi:hypothetical protein